MGVFAWIGVALVAGVFVPHLKAFWQAKFRPVSKSGRERNPRSPCRRREKGLRLHKISTPASWT
jgi:hypothetical protein